MEEYTIEIYGAERLLKREQEYYQDCLDEDEPEEAKETAKRIAIIQEWVDDNEVVVHSLSEYFKLMDTIAELTDDAYTITNCGQAVDFLAYYD